MAVGQVSLFISTGFQRDRNESTNGRGCERGTSRSCRKENCFLGSELEFISFGKFDENDCNEES